VGKCVCDPLFLGSPDSRGSRDRGGEGEGDMEVRISDFRWGDRQRPVA
jgi:hypothetical protein